MKHLYQVKVDSERFMAGTYNFKPQEKLRVCFESVLNVLNFSTGDRFHFCKIRNHEIVRESYGNQPYNATDDRVTELNVK